MPVPPRVWLDENYDRETYPYTLPCRGILKDVLVYAEHWVAWIAETPCQVVSTFVRAYSCKFVSKFTPFKR